MNWFDKLLPPKIKSRGTAKKAVPEGLWSKCPGCGSVLYHAEIEKNQSVCPRCDHHMRIGARKRLDAFLDAGERTEIGADLHPVDFLKFKDSKRYKDRLVEAAKNTGESDALVVVRGRLWGMGWPVRYNSDRDCRTIFSLAYPQGGIPVEEKGVAHNALDDAIWQARTVQACMQKLRDRAHP